MAEVNVTKPILASTPSPVAKKLPKTVAQTLAELEGPDPVPQAEIAIDQAASEVVGSADFAPPIPSAVSASTADTDKALRIAKAKTAAATRWSQEFDWDGADLQEALIHLAELRAATQVGAIACERRASSQRVDEVSCAHCGNKIRVQAAKGYRSRTNPETGLIEVGYACSAACFMYMGREWVQTGAVKEPKVRS